LGVLTARWNVRKVKVPARKKKFCPYGRPVLSEPLVWLVRSVPEDVVPDDSEYPLLLVIPDVVEPSEKGLWKGLL